MTEVGSIMERYYIFNERVTVKGKVVLVPLTEHHAMKAYWGMEI
jgi:hypothetical protein